MRSTQLSFPSSIVYSLLFHLALFALTLSVSNSQAKILNDTKPIEVSFIALKHHTENPAPGVLTAPQEETKPNQVPADPPPPAKVKPKKVQKAVLKQGAKPSPEVKTEPVATEVLSKSPNNSATENSTSAGLAQSGRAQFGVPGATGAEFGANYEQLIVSWLAKYKRYPERARKKNISGEGLLRIVIERNGELREAEITRSTTSDILDKELEKLASRASPFPPPPNNYPGAPLEFLVPISFRIE